MGDHLISTILFSLAEILGKLKKTVAIYRKGVAVDTVKVRCADQLLLNLVTGEFHNIIFVGPLCYRDLLGQHHRNMR